MVISFKRVKLVNFGSYQTAEIDLQNKGICLVSGENHCKKDNASSNGSGKSTLWSAICYALTGETISGQTNNLKNINIEEDDCFVELEFVVDGDNYIITRINKPKSDLKILKNGTDISGKGITESKKILEQTLPDLTKDLVSSTILLGQNLPNKFSSFSPSGRKELLEKLTKSDFMISDIKERTDKRHEEVNKKIADLNSSILVNKTNLSNVENLKKAAELELNSLQEQDFDTEILNLSLKISDTEKSIETINNAIKYLEVEFDGLNQIAIKLANEKSDEFADLNDKYTAGTNKNRDEKVKLDTEIKNLEAEVRKLKSIKDTCPTCGQKLPNVNKPSTEKQEKEISDKNALLEKVSLELNEAAKKYNEYKVEIENNFSTRILSNQLEISNKKNQISEQKLKLNSFSNQLISDKEQLSKAKFSKESYEKRISYLNDQIKTNETEAHELDELIRITELSVAELKERAAIINKMITLTKRDFRGYLLSDIIKYIDQKAKEYCEVVFGTRDLLIELNGNSLDITYCGKSIESLSGGERTKVDLILQLAIRSLLQTYMNFSSNIIVLDEVTDFLDKTGSKALFELLFNILKDVESTFIISHRAEELDLPVDSTLNIVKDEFGISSINN